MGKIKKVQPHGPYFISGWSLGGTLAFAVVEELERMAETVGFFALVDSPPPHQAPYEEDIEFTLEAEKELMRNLPINEKI